MTTDGGGDNIPEKMETSQGIHINLIRLFFIGSFLKTLKNVDSEIEQKFKNIHVLINLPQAASQLRMYLFCY